MNRPTGAGAADVLPASPALGSDGEHLQRNRQSGLFGRLQAELAGLIRQHVLAATKVASRGIAGLTTGANEHDTVSVPAAVGVVLYPLRQFSAGRAATGP